MNISDLPPDLLARILSFLPLCDLLRASTVSTTWSAPVRTACSNRSTLWLAIGPDARQIDSEFAFPLLYQLVADDGRTPLARRPITEYSLLTLPSLGQLTTTDRLFTTFPSITHLSVTFYGPFRHLSQVCHLLSRYSPTLRSLHLILVYMDKAHHSRIRAPITMATLFTTLNGLPLLTSLTFEFESRILIRWNPSLDLPILARLRVFYFNSLDHPGLLLESLANYGKGNAALRKIGFAQDLYGFRDFRLLLKGDVELARKVTHLRTWLRSDAESRTEYASSLFTSLTTLVIYLPYVPRYLSISDLLHDLAPMESLLTLHINLAENLSSGRKPAGRLASIRGLTLSYNKHRTVGLDRFHLWWTLPALQILQVHAQTFKCKACATETNLGEASSAVCIRQHLLRPLKRCSALRRIELCPPKGSTIVLLPSEL